MDNIQKWTQKFPFGFEEFTEALSCDKRIAIVSLLMERDELKFSEIQKELGLDSSLLSQHLNKLLNLGLLRRKRSTWSEDRKYIKSYYVLSPFYRRLIDTCRKSLVNQKQVPFSFPYENPEFLINSDILESMVLEQNDYHFENLIKSDIYPEKKVERVFSIVKKSDYLDEQQNLIVIQKTTYEFLLSQPESSNPMGKYKVAIEIWGVYYGDIGKSIKNGLYIQRF